MGTWTGDPATYFEFSSGEHPSIEKGGDEIKDLQVSPDDTGTNRAIIAAENSTRTEDSAWGDGSMTTSHEGIYRLANISLLVSKLVDGADEAQVPDATASSKGAPGRGPRSSSS